MDLALVEKGEIGKEFLIKQVWKDKSFGITLKSYLERELFAWDAAIAEEVHF